MKKHLAKVKALALAAFATVGLPALSHAAVTDFGISTMALNLDPIESLIGIIIPGLFLIWAVRKVIKISNRS